MITAAKSIFTHSYNTSRPQSYPVSTAVPRHQQSRFLRPWLGRPDHDGRAPAQIYGRRFGLTSVCTRQWRCHPPGDWVRQITAGTILSARRARLNPQRRQSGSLDRALINQPLSRPARVRSRHPGAAVWTVTGGGRQDTLLSAGWGF